MRDAGIIANMNLSLCYTRSMTVETDDILEKANLRFINDTTPGITREKHKDSFLYILPNGNIVKDEKTLERINSLGIPPAWEDVWVSPYANGHIQAIGKDAKGRKQYRYHSKWVEETQNTKFDNMLAFAKALPQIRKRVRYDLNKEGMPKEKVLATIVWLLEHTLIRVGNKEYEKENKSYGLTTLKNKHVDIDGPEITFTFKGKSGVYHDVDIRNKKVAKIIKNCQNLPGQQLFQYVDDNGKRHTISSEDVNEYLKEITGSEFTAKDFRTWAATTMAAELLDKVGLVDTKTDLKKTLSDTVKVVSSYLRNKPSTCRKYYIHPVVFTAYEKGDVLSVIDKKVKKIADFDFELDEEENRVVKFLYYHSN